MRVRHIALFFIASAFVWSACPFSAKAIDLSPFVINDMPFHGMALIPDTPGRLQTALKAGDTPIFQVNVQSFLAFAPTVSVDLSGLGVASPTTTPANAAGASHHYVKKDGLIIDYHPNYFYDFGPFIIGADIPDGQKTISVEATDAAGLVTTAAAHITVDNAPPTISLTNITFSTTSPRTGDYMYLSGMADGTGSAVKTLGIFEGLFDAEGNSLPGSFHDDMISYDSDILTNAFASSTDGTFAKVPIRLFESDNPGQIARATSFRVRIVVYDEAGNTASSSLTVRVPKTRDDLCTLDGCVSNVLFLPGIEGSRLYEGTGCGKDAEEKLWEPLGESMIKILFGAGDKKVRGLFLNQNGESVCDDIYAKANDIIDSVGGNDIYQSFSNEMGALKASGDIADWKAVAYDWRLSLTDLLNNGAERGGKIFYEEATSTPYIEQTLRALAASSKTGKVTIVAHSNGGLVAKALADKLGGSAAELVDKIILVGAPQSGAPVAEGALLYGLGQGISSWGIPILHASVAQKLAENSPMAYHLLPSQNYFESVASDANHPVARFAGSGYADEISAYGAVINNSSDLDTFLLASTTLNASLVDYANGQHATLDSWTPPAGIEVDQIAGWGADTVAGIDFYTLPPVSGLESLGPQRAYRPIFTEDGDGTVPVPSALMMTSDTNVKRYWLNLDSYFRATSIKRSHKDLFEIPSLQDFIKNIIENSTSTLPSHISTSQPAPIIGNKKLTFFLHSPLTLQLTDSSGNITGLATDDSIAENIPGSSYGEFGDVKYVTVPEGDTYQLTLHGQASGTFSLDMQETTDGVITASGTIANVPTATSTLVTLNISGGLDTASALTVDENNDGTNIITITPRTGEIVNYLPPEDSNPVEELPLEDPELVEGLPPVPESHSGSGGAYYAPVITPTIIATTSPDTLGSVVGLRSASSTPATVSTSSPQAATSTLAIQTKKKPLAPIATIKPKPKETVVPLVPQTASVYEASQQPFLKRVAARVYNGLYGFWSALKKLF